MKSLSIEEIESLATQFKDDLTRRCKREVRKHTGESAIAALVAVEAEEQIDAFVQTLKMWAGADWQKLARPARARDVNLSVVRGKR